MRRNRLARWALASRWAQAPARPDERLPARRWPQLPAPIPLLALLALPQCAPPSAPSGEVPRIAAERAGFVPGGPDRDPAERLVAVCFTQLRGNRPIDDFGKLRALVYGAIAE